VVARTPPLGPQGRHVPPTLDRDRAALAHPARKTREQGVEFAQAARQQIMDVPGLRDARAKVVSRGIGIALNERDRVDKVTQDPGGTHPGDAAADHDRPRGWHGVPLHEVRSPDEEAVALTASPVVQGKVPVSTTATVQVVTRLRQSRGCAPTIGCEPHARSERSESQHCFMDTTRPRI
jgi:hypothetical protein